jgi:hypothetical protein
MGKHETGYPRIHRDHYPTPSWVVEALAEKVDLIGRRIWEPAAGTGQMVTALRLHGAKVYATDIEQRRFPLDQVLDFISAPTPKFDFDTIATNPPFGSQGKTAETFIEVGLGHITKRGGTLALLLPVDFDSAKTRHRFFADCPSFAAKIVLTQRVAWFERPDGERANPKENSTWFLWQCPLLQIRQPPIVLYAPSAEVPPAQHKKRKRKRQ